MALVPTKKDSSARVNELDCVCKRKLQTDDSHAVPKQTASWRLKNLYNGLNYTGKVSRGLSN